MAKSPPNYFIVFLMLLAATAATYWVRTRPPSALYTAQLDSFPQKLGLWEGKDLKINSDVRKVLDADDVLSRGYRNSKIDSPLGLLVVYRKYGRRGFAHRPEACYPAAGWTIVSRGYTRIPFGNGTARAVKVVAEKDGAREIIVYWFASGALTEANYLKQQILMAYDRLRSHKYGWAFIRINSPVAISEEVTMENIRSFAGAAADPMKEVLTGDRAQAHRPETPNRRIAARRP